MTRNFLIVLKKSTSDVIKTASKGVIQKTAEAIGDLIGNKITESEAENTELNKEIPKEVYISPEKRQQIIDELRFI